jgi:hypothetical protein
LGTTSIPACIIWSRVHASCSEVGPTESVVDPGVSSPVIDLLMIADFWNKFYFNTSPVLSPQPPAFSPVTSCK